MSGAIGQNFLRHIVANIEDSVPRLVFADWLDEQNQPDRAEFIRVQVERARLPAWDRAQVRLRLREQRLLAHYSEKWLAEFPTIDGAKWEGFRRGVVAEVAFASFEAMRAHAHECRAVAPVEAITVRWPREREPRTGGPPIAELRELVLTGRPSNETEVARLAESPQLATLQSLTIHHIWPAGLARLLASPHLSGLKSLRLPLNTLGNIGLRDLTRARTLTHLESLDLSARHAAGRYHDGPAMRADGIEALANWPALATVRTLRLDGNEIGRDGLRALARSRYTAGLKELYLPSSRIEGHMLAELREAAPTLRLDVFNLSENMLRVVGCEYLATLPCFRELKDLHIGRCEIRLDEMQLLARKAAFLEQLQVLNVDDNYLRAAGLRALLEKRPVLHTLSIFNNDLGLEGLRHLTESEATNQLWYLDIGFNELNDQAADLLGTTAHLQNLVHLRAFDNGFTTAAVRQLRASPLGQRLQQLEVRDWPPANLPADSDDIPF
jgi:uncharacterized protein (TIGR02996 family)